MAANKGAVAACILAACPEHSGLKTELADIAKAMETRTDVVNGIFSVIRTDLANMSDKLDEGMQRLPVWATLMMMVLAALTSGIGVAFGMYVHLKP